MRLRHGLLFAALLLTGCDHHKPVEQTQNGTGAAAVESDSALTGLPPQPANPATEPAKEPTYPRATLATLPSDSATPELNPPTDTAPVNPPADTAPADTSTEPPPRLTSSVPTLSPTPKPEDLPDLPPTPTVPTDTAPAVTEVKPATPPANDTAQEKQVVVVETSFGRIVIDLDDTAAPQTCANFRKLVASGFYNKTVFHRVISHFVIQGGDPNSKSDDRSTYGQGGPGYTVPAEIKLAHDRGAVAMARAPDSVNPQRESNGSQFYICVVDCPSLDDKYTVFGHVIKGLDIADKIAEQPRDTRDNPLNRIEMEVSLEPKSKALEEVSASNP